MIRIDGLRAGIGADFSPEDIAAKQLRISRADILSVHILRRTLDCRKKGDIHYALSLGVELKCDEQKVARYSRNSGVRVCDKPIEGIDAFLSKNNLSGKFGEVAVVGSGPAGLMCALTLAKAGVKPIVIERGKQVEERIKDVDNFFNGGALNIESNVQYGEGGAGTFSDGKLNSGVGGEIAAIVLREFARHGGGEQLVYEGKPHIGTDVLPKVVSAIRKEIIRLGGKFMFSTKVEDIVCKGGALSGLLLTGENAGVLDCSTAVFAIGHSARDTYEMLARNNVMMSVKPFSIGVRIEHLQQDINIAQYGCIRNDLPAADYKLSADIDGRGCYTFCMCPGGEVVAAASELSGTVVNGMSNSRRDGGNANSAVLASVTPADFGDKLFDGVEFQRKYERAAYALSNGYAPPVQRLEDFKKGVCGSSFGAVSSSCKRGYAFADLNACLPNYAADTIKKAVDVFAKKIPVFNHPDSLLSGVETRSSAPLRILRGDDGHSSIKGLLPCGEGAGYAGGITSAAADGIKTAVKILSSL